ncbi:hypothetical protein [Lewinella sp. LCG006]|uniref:hypothetical protein n=1 Tax=Lewinella sp. LCG006 TaxID=3231911 RepID=UPI0034602A9F
MKVLFRSTVLLLLLGLSGYTAAQADGSSRPWAAFSKEVSVATGISGFGTSQSLWGYSEHAVTKSRFVNIDMGMSYPIKGRFFVHTGLGLGYTAVNAFSDRGYRLSGNILVDRGRTERSTAAKYMDVIVPLLGGMQVGKHKKINISLGATFSYRAAEQMKVEGVVYQYYSSIALGTEDVGQIGNGPPPSDDPFIFTGIPTNWEPWNESPASAAPYSYEAELPTSRFQVAATSKVSYALPFKKGLKGTSIGIQGLWYLTEYNIGDGQLARYRVQVVVGRQF